MNSRLFVAVLLCVLVAFSGCSGSTHRKGYTRVTKSSRVQKKAEIGYTFDVNLFHWFELNAAHNEDAWAARVSRPLMIFMEKILLMSSILEKSRD